LSENDQPHMPPPSLWPIGFAIGVACVLTGIVVSPIVAVVGAGIAIVFGFLWLRDVTKPVRTPAPEVEPERRETYVAITPAEDDEPAEYPRSTFLSVATLGLGAAIGGLITLPVLGFAVLPSFTNTSENDIELGPIDDFPEGEFVIATFLEDPEVGEVTRRTMFIRNNGRNDDDVPSFTMLYSRCAHLGCPVQPNGLIMEDETKTVGPQNADVTPVLVTGFGCPCHGGQYDTEGNRVAGPPVRALDRSEFSIIDGNLVVGSFFSVAKVEGAGANARIYRYRRQVPGVHVDGPSAWLYPIEVPQ
jgi:Rieske Fe-S protein